MLDSFLNCTAQARSLLDDYQVLNKYLFMLMHLTKVQAVSIITTWDGQVFRERCGSSGGNSLPTPLAWSIWRRAGGRMDSCVRPVGARSIG